MIILESRVRGGVIRRIGRKRVRGGRRIIPNLDVKLLIHLNSDFSDSSSANRTPSTVGPPFVSATQKVFGAKS